MRGAAGRFLAAFGGTILLWLGVTWVRVQIQRDRERSPNPYGAQQ